MKQLKKKIFLAAIVSAFTVFHSKAQDEDQRIAPAQITFVTPLGTNGAASANTINHFSLNLLWGASAGVLGFEAGGLLNQTFGGVHGMQVGGLGNITSGTLTGMQVGGLLNTSSSRLLGAQVAGLLNISSAKTGGNEENFSSGAQLSGLININQNRMKGVQSAGLLNQQSASFEGLQVAGLMNNSEEHFKGVQIAGLLNKVKILSGVQIGIINIADTIEKGIPIGILNIVKDGYSAFEVETSESFYGSINYKLGVQRFYSIFSVAYKEQDGMPFWAPGFGFGTFIPISQKAGINIDAISYHVNEDEWWTNYQNQLNKLKINGSWHFGRRMAVYGGVSVNVFVTEVKSDEGNLRGSAFKTPNSFFNEVHKDTRVIIYPGINAGIRF